MDNHFFSSRREFLKKSVLGAIGGVASAKAFARPCSYSLARTLVKQTTSLPERTYYTYPHSNGFLDAQTCIVARHAAKSELEYLAVDLTTGESRVVAQVRDARAYYAVALNGLMVVPLNHAIVIVDLKGGGAPRRIELSPQWKNAGDCDIRPDGAFVLVSRYKLTDPAQTCLDMINTQTSVITNIHETSQLQIDHAHFSPHDPDWISFCDGSSHTRHRMWLWHATKAPNCRTVFHQKVANGTSFEIGHERAMFNKDSLLVCAFSSSSASPRGLYEVSFDGTTRFVSESNRDSHCNVSHDGRWAVASTLGPANTEGGKFDLCERAPSNWAESTKGYVDSDIAAVNIATGERQFLFRASNAVTKANNGSEGYTSSQPYEAQPAISPDGRWILVKDARTQSVISIEIDRDALRAFLAG